MQKRASRDGQIAQAWRRLAIPGLAVAILLAGFRAQSETYLNHDVAWVLDSARRMFDGAVFGRDIVAANPPLIWWLSTIPDGIAMLTGLPTIAVFRACVLVLSAASLLVSNRLFFPEGAARLPQLLFLGAGAWLFAFAIHRDYGQREHIAVLLILPYVAALVRRTAGRPMRPGLGFAVGAAAGIGIAFKPYFVAVPLLLEGLLLWRMRAPRLLLRPEALGAGLAVALYAVAILLFARPWLFETMPDIRQVYWAFEQPVIGGLPRLARKFLPPLLLLACGLVRNRSTASLALFLAALGFFGAAVIQGKYYTYHLYPAHALLLLAFVVGVERPAHLRPLPVLALAAMVMAQSAIETRLVLAGREPDGAVGKSIKSMTGFVEQHVPPGGTFLGISTHPFPGYPTALYAERRWGSASNSQIFLPSVVRLRAGGPVGDPAMLAFAERKAHDAMARDMALKPDLVLVDINPIRHAIGGTKFDFVEFYREDPRFRAAWSDYIRLDSAPEGFAAYARKSSGGEERGKR